MGASYCKVLGRVGHAFLCVLLSCGVGQVFSSVSFCVLWGQVTNSCGSLLLSLGGGGASCYTRAPGALDVLLWMLFL